MCKHLAQTPGQCGSSAISAPLPAQRQCSACWIDWRQALGCGSLEASRLSASVRSSYTMSRHPRLNTHYAVARKRPISRLRISFPHAIAKKDCETAEYPPPSAAKSERLDHIITALRLRAPAFGSSDSSKHPSWTHGSLSHGLKGIQTPESVLRRLMHGRTDFSHAPMTAFGDNESSHLGAE
ncbi:hypothetical protein BDV11DRAFT_14729 [Aspergillus similis]